jgi:hypothetical protein
MLLELFSKRRRRERGEIVDIFSYDDLPSVLRVQVVHLLCDGLEPTGGGQDLHSDEAYQFLHNTLAREYGMFFLSDAANSRYPNFSKALYDFFLNIDDVERALDVVELALRYIERVVPEWSRATPRRANRESVVDELNGRFREAGVGYQYQSGEILRVDSQLLHEEAVKPTLRLLSNSGFDGANDEFLRAHEHYRHGRHKEALNEALKALESTIKTVCAQRGWPVEPTATASRLLEVCFSNGLLPSALQAHFGALRATLEAGIPTIRNKMSGHGQGQEPLPVPQHIVAYGLNITASAIRFICEASASAG